MKRAKTRSWQWHLMRRWSQLLRVPVLVLVEPENPFKSEMAQHFKELSFDLSQWELSVARRKLSSGMKTNATN